MILICSNVFFGFVWYQDVFGDDRALPSDFLICYFAFSANDDAFGARDCDCDPRKRRYVDCLTMATLVEYDTSIGKYKHKRIRGREARRKGNKAK